MVINKDFVCLHFSFYFASLPNGWKLLNVARGIAKFRRRLAIRRTNLEGSSYKIYEF